MQNRITSIETPRLAMQQCGKIADRRQQYQNCEQIIDAASISCEEIGCNNSLLADGWRAILLGSDRVG